jgi:hypothetical protein
MSVSLQQRSIPGQRPGRQSVRAVASRRLCTGNRLHRALAADLRDCADRCSLVLQFAMKDDAEYQTIDTAAGTTTLIKCLSQLVRDNQRVEDIRKVDGDDPADAAQYGLVSGGRLAGVGATPFRRTQGGALAALFKRPGDTTIRHRNARRRADPPPGQRNGSHVSGDSLSAPGARSEKALRTQKLPRRR